MTNDTLTELLLEDENEPVQKEEDSEKKPSVEKPALSDEDSAVTSDYLASPLIAPSEIEPFQDLWGGFSPSDIL